ncbi:TAH18_2 [Sanghuangporus weigelae]
MFLLADLLSDILECPHFKFSDWEAAHMRKSAGRPRCPSTSRIHNYFGKTLDCVDDPLSGFKEYLLAAVRRNDRITSAEWVQDVRHIELDLEDDVMYLLFPSYKLYSPHRMSIFPWQHGLD